MTLATAARLRFTVNGRPAEVAGPGGRRLLDLLRLELGLTGTKEGCGEGECGACSVLLDGELVASCLVPVAQVQGRAVLTVEGLAREGRLDPLQVAFLETGASQCGFCTPAMLLAGRAFLASGAEPTEDAIREAIAGTLCRCTGYTRIVEGIRLAATDPPGAAIPAPALAPLAEAGGSPAALPSGAPEVVSPGSLADALAVLAAEHPRPIAGGTDLMVGLASRAATAAWPLLDLGDLDELRGIRLEPGRAAQFGALVLGALTTYAELRRSALVAEHLPVLAEMAASVGAVQVQNRGTLGGNIVTASPAGDSLPLLLATDAEILVESLRGRRSVPAAAFWPAYRQTALASDELVLAVRVPLPVGRHVRFRKVGTRQAQAIAKASVALAWREEGGTWREVRVALGSLAPTPVRALATEAVLEGQRPTAALADRAAATVAAEISPIDDVRSTAVYRRSVTARVLRRLILDAVPGRKAG